jgi:hypothetical protein
MANPTVETSHPSPMPQPLNAQHGSDECESGPEIVQQQLAVAKTVLTQAIALLDNHITSDEQLTVHSKHLPGSTIGML